VQQTAILLGCGVLPHLSSLVAVVAGGLSDAGAPKVRTMAGLALAALAEAAAPYGIDAFDDVLEPLWKGVRLLRGKALAAYLKAIGNIIPLMDATYANYYTREVRGVLCFCFCFLRREKEERETHLSKKKKKQVMVVLLREFASPDDEMKRIVLKVVAQCVGADGVPASYVRDEVLPGFFEHFWVRRMALDRRAYKSVLETTVEVARKVGGACVLGRIVEDLKDEAEPYRRLVMDAVRRILREQGAADVDARLEELLVDGALYAYQEQGDDDGDEKSNSASSKIVLDGFGAIVSSLGRRAKPYLAQVCGTIKWRLNNRAPRVRAQAADLVAAVAPTMVRFFFFRRLGPLAFASLVFLRAPRERKT
jgi:splicing factor 3B subunit 1